MCSRSLHAIFFLSDRFVSARTKFCWCKKYMFQLGIPIPGSGSRDPGIGSIPNPGIETVGIPKSRFTKTQFWRSNKQASLYTREGRNMSVARRSLLRDNVMSKWLSHLIICANISGSLENVRRRPRCGFVRSLNIIKLGAEALCVPQELYNVTNRTDGWIDADTLSKSADSMQPELRQSRPHAAAAASSAGDRCNKSCPWRARMPGNTSEEIFNFI